MLVACLGLVLGASAASSKNTTSTSDIAATLSGPTTVKIGDTATFTLMVTNKGPDPTDSEISVGFVWQDSTSAAEFVSYDGPEPCSYVQGGFNGDPSYLNCTAAPAGFAVGATMTFHLSVKWTSQYYTQLQGSVTAPTGDPDTSNNIGSLSVLSEPNPPDGGGGGSGGGGGGSGGGGTPVAPSYAFATSLPDATQYILYSIATVPCDPTVQCPQEVQLTSGTLPPGIKLQQDANGGLIGNPTTPGSYAFTLTAVANTGSNLATLTHTYTLVVVPLRSTSSGAPSPKAIFPSGSRTPGAVNPAVTQATIKKTICVANWMSKVSPPVSYTDTLKLTQMKQYGEKGSPTAYEEDHLIPLELGGATRNPRNLWPEPQSQSKHSDPLETALKHKVCHGNLTLAAARKQILAYKRKHG